MSESSKEDNIHVVQLDNLQYLDFSGGINLPRNKKYGKMLQPKSGKSQYQTQQLCIK